MRTLLTRIAAWSVERPIPVLAATGLAVLLAAFAALRLEPDAGTDQLVDRDSRAFAATERFKEEFGDDPVVVLVEGDLEQLVLGPALGTLLALEGCLSGNAAAGQAVAAAGQAVTGEPVPEPCAELAEQRPARVVYGPATFLNQFAIQAGELLREQIAAGTREARTAAARAAAAARRQGRPPAEQRAAAQAAGQEVLSALVQQFLALSVRYGQAPRIPTIDDPRFVRSVVFDPRTPDEPKSRFSYLFPSGESALISVRLRPGLDEAGRREAIDLIQAAVADPAFEIGDAEYVVSGVPVVVEGLAEKLSSEILVLLVVALAVMAAVLTMVFGPPLRLLALAVALAAAALLFGLLAIVDGSLTMASLALLPILIGLTVDYAIQFQSRFLEARSGGSSPPRAAVEAAARGGPVIAIATFATAAGFCVLALSPIPMVRGFGLLLVVGIAIAFGLALTAGLAALSLTGGGPRRAGTAPGPFARIAAGPGGVGARMRAIGSRALAVSVAAPGRVLAVGLALAVLGWALGTRSEVISDIRELVPRDLPELEDVDRLQRGTGVSGEVGVTVTADEITDPAVIAWMSDYKQRVLERAGFSEESGACVDQTTRLCPSIALPDLFDNERGAPTTARVRHVLALLPPYFSQAVISTDPATGELGDSAVISFGIKVMPFAAQARLIDAIRAEIDPAGAGADPPQGVAAEVVGLPVLAAEASSALEGNRYLLTGAGLLAVALALLAAYRSLRRALVPLIPILLATGWSSLGLAIAGVPLNPMSATLGALVIAIATEFSVLLCGRFEEERAGEVSIGEALRRAYSRTGAAVLASGITAIAGFAALIATDIRMLRDFGIVTVIDLSVALLGVLVILPAVLVWAEARSAPSAASKPATA